MSPQAPAVVEAPVNRLAREKSPYLLQHARNPVDWFPWGEAAFAKARKENKPIFLSIGYSTCHWCHVMERESFEDAETAAFLNQGFVSIKVDREERPDVDAIYMAYVQAVTGTGGWPMSVWLTPSLKPFYGGTYFPPEERDGRIGFKTLLARIAEAWQADPARIEATADSALAQLRDAVGRAQGGDLPDHNLPDLVFGRIRDSYDPVYGGFGGAPKFPRPALLHFLLRHAALTGSREASAMALNTLRRMADGGIHDRIGGGFHRYAVDERWRLPHFEKMLYDQAQLALAYLEGFWLTREPALAVVAREILEYVRRDMTGPEGQFFSAEDADSPEPGHPDSLAEGAFYLWEAAEVRGVLGDRLGSLFARHHGVKSDGNLGVAGGGELRGKNVLIVAESLEDSARGVNAAPEEAKRMLEQGRARLFERRSARPRPRRDDKSLAAWNGLMISAYARGYQVFGDTTYLEAAERAMRFIRNRLVREPDQLWRRFREGEASVEGACLDYACVIQAALDLYECVFNPHWIEWAIRLQERQNALFLDDKAGGYFDAAPDSRLLLRLKEMYDGSEPSANSVSALNLLRLHQAAPERGYGALADGVFAAFARTLADAPDSAPQLAAALALRQHGVRQVVVAGQTQASDTAALLKAIRQTFRPDLAVFLADGGPGQAALAASMPVVRDMTARDGKAAAYVCQDFVCREPVTDPRLLLEQLADRPLDA